MVTFAVILALCSEARGQTKICDPEKPDHCSQPLKKGDTAPFGGQLYTPKLAIDQATKAHDCDEVVEIEVGAAVEPIQLKLEAEKSLRAIDSREWAAKNDLLKERLQEAHSAAERSWYENPMVWFTVGVITTLGAVYLGTKIVKANR